MNTKFKKVFIYVLPPIFFLFFGLIFKLINIHVIEFTDLKYLSYTDDLLWSILLGALITVIYLATLKINKNIKRIGFKIVIWIISVVLILFGLAFGSFFMLVAGVVSETDDVENYLDFDNCGLASNEYFEFLPTEIPENAENIIYSYQYRLNFFDGAYAYAEWTLPEVEYQAEKQRLTDLLYPRIPHEIDGETVYENWISAIGEAQISLNDEENKVSYFISSGEEIGSEWKKKIDE